MRELVEDHYHLKTIGFCWMPMCFEEDCVSFYLQKIEGHRITVIQHHGWTAEIKCPDKKCSGTSEADSLEELLAWIFPDPD